MSGMDDLVTWLRAQLDDDERVARESTPGPWNLDAAPDGRWYVDPGHGADDVGDVVRRADAEHIARHDPARVLAEVDAKRRILDVYRAEVIDVSVIPERPEWMHGRVPVEAHTVLRLLALPYADRPGYRDEWKP